MCMCVYIIAEKLNMAEDSDTEIINGVHEVMGVASRTQGLVERALSTSRRAISVNELIKHSGVVLDAAGIGCDEILVDGNTGIRTKLEQQVEGPCRWKPNSCLVHLGMIPASLLPRETGQGAVTCVMTSNGHSVALWCYNFRNYGIFDPGNGMVTTGMNMQEFDSLLFSIAGLDKNGPQENTGAVQIDFTLLYAK